MILLDVTTVFIALLNTLDGTDFGRESSSVLP
jgi:hypothetical protein